MNEFERQKRSGVPVLYDIETDSETLLPWCWAICCSCDGHGTTTRHVECDGGGFTASEWAEQDEDFREGYLRGDYDRPCSSCKGSGKVKVPNEDQMTTEQIAAWREQAAEDRDYERLCEMERRMGA